MTDKKCVLHSDSDLFVLRYVKPSYIKNSEPTDDVFQLRDDWVPPEEFVSFYRFENEDLDNRFMDFTVFMNKKFNISNNSGVIHIDANEACDEINTPRELISFKDCNSPHYGLFFLSESDEDRLEAKTMLLFCSTFQFTRNIKLSIKNRIIER